MCESRLPAIAWAPLVMVSLTGCPFPPPPPLFDAGPPDGGDLDAAEPDAAVPRHARVVFTAAGDIHAVDVDDGTPGAAVLLTTPAFTNPTATISDLQVSASGDVITFLVDATVEGEVDLYAIRRTGSAFTAPIRLSIDHGASLLFGPVREPDGAAVVYGYGFDGGFGFLAEEYYFVDLSTAIPGTPTPLSGGGGYLAAGQFSPDGRRFAFLDTSIATSQTTAQLVDTSGPIPSAATQISPVAPTARSVNNGFCYSPDSARIAFLGDFATNDVLDLYVVDISAAVPGAAEKASGPLVTGGGVDVALAGPRIAFSPDSTRLAYVADAITNGVNELFIVNVTAATPSSAVKVNGPFVTGGSLPDDPLGAEPWAFAADSDAIAYLADERINDVTELFLVDISGAAPSASQRLSGALPTSGDVAMLCMSPTADGLAYLADQRVNDITELFHVDLRNPVPSTSQLVNADLLTDEDIGTGFAGGVTFSPDGTRLVYVVTAGNGSQALHRAAITAGAPAAPHRIQDATNPAATVGPIAISADSRTLVHRANPTASTDLWLTDITSPSPSTPSAVNGAAAPVDTVVLRP